MCLQATQAPAATSLKRDIYLLQYIFAPSEVSFIRMSGSFPSSSEGRGLDPINPLMLKSEAKAWLESTLPTIISLGTAKEHSVEHRSPWVYPRWRTVNPFGPMSVILKS